MDSVTLATITASLTLLGTEVAKGAASKAGKDLWQRIKSLIGFATDPPQDALAKSLAEKLTQLPDERLKEILEQLKKSETASGSLVGHLNAENVVVAERIDIQKGSIFDQRGGR